jgi:nicotinate-nucleotide adenylyltransferase
VRLGVVGGTFDPIHLGHIVMAEGAADCVPLDRVLLIPAAEPPHRGPAAAPAHDRLEMARIAAAGHPRLEVCDIEVRRSGPSFTVDTLRELARKRPGDELYLVLGWDAARDIAAWRDPRELMRLARLVVVPRPGYPAPRPEDLVAAGIDPERTLLCDISTPAVESRDIRRMLERGEGLTGLLDPGVEAYLRDRRLYAA